MESILLKAIKDVDGNYTGIGELTPDEIAVLTGPLKFADGTEQTTAATSGAIDSVFGRTGVVVAVAGDYTAAQVSFDATGIDGMSATEVQSAIAELANTVKETASDLLFMGLLGFDDADPAAPTQPGPSHYYIFKTAGARTVGDATGVAVSIGDWLAYSRADSKWVHLDYAARQATAAGTTYNPGVTAKANTYLTATDVQGALDQADAALGAANTRIDNLELAPGGVSSFNTRTGAVVPATGDYTATQTTFAPTATVLATNVQAAIAEVDAKIIGIALPFFDTDGVSKPIPMA
jgi:hypothetical protein